jgi:hypothetical protein
MFEKGLIGAGRALIGGHSTLSFGFAKNAVEKHFPDKPLREEYYFLQGYSHGLAVFVLVLSVVAVLGLLVLVVFWLRRPTLDRSGKTLAALCLAWLLSYLPIELYWDPFNIELWYVTWIPAAALLALPLGDRLLPRLGARPLAAVTLGSLLLANLLGSVWPQHDSSKDYWRARAAWYRAHTSPSDTILATGYLQSSYLRYLTKAHVIDADSVFADAPDDSAAIVIIRQQLERSHAEHVYVSSEVFDPYSDTPAGCPRVDPTVCAEAVLLRQAFRPDSTLIAQVPSERVWELRLPGSAASA